VWPSDGLKHSRELIAIRESGLWSFVGGKVLVPDLREWKVPIVQMDALLRTKKTISCTFDDW
jgi:hypothetical protein